MHLFARPPMHPLARPSMHPLARLRWISITASLAFLALGVHSCDRYGLGSPSLFWKAPLLGQLSLLSGVEAELRMGGLVDRDTLEVLLDGAAIDPANLAVASSAGGFSLLPKPSTLTTVLPDLQEGTHRLEAHATLDLLFFEIPLHAVTWFDTTELERPDECEILSRAHCALPFPSSRFLTPAPGETASGWRIDFPEIQLTGVTGPPLDPTPLARLDGFAPTVQAIVHLAGVDPAQSGASRLLPTGVPQSPPYVGVRTHDDSSLDGDSPTVLLDVDTGERVLHWVELDQTPAALADPSRQVLFLRPAQSLVPGHRYIVAFRRMKDASGETIPAESVFATLRDRRPTTIDAVEARREAMEDVFDELRRAGVPRENLQLAFDFRVRSAEQLHERMLFMRDDALAWLASVAPTDVSGFSNLTVETFGPCTSPSQSIWRRVRGKFAGPSYMDRSIDDVSQPAFLNVDAAGMPVRNGTFPFSFSVAVPCSVYRGEQVGHPLLLGHGFLGDGAGMVDAFVGGGFFGGGGDVAYIAGATDWRGLALGLAGPDALSILFHVIGTPQTGHRFNTFEVLPNRLKQGVVNTLVLSRMMKSGFFNRLPAFQRVANDPSTGVFEPAAEMFYFGVSLGGIYGTFYAALNADTIRHNVDVPAMNFSLLEQRSTQFPVFLNLIQGVGLTDPLELSLLLGIQHELWVSAEPAAYIRNVTGEVDPTLPGSPPKQLLVTVAFLDKQVSNQATEIYARSLGIPHLQGSVLAGLAELPDVAADASAGGPGLASAMQIYDTGWFDIFDPAYDAVLPPLANIIPSSKCDPHGGARLSIPASIAQLQAFLQPGGRIYNFCDGICDGAIPFEQPSTSCDPLN